MPDRPYRVPHRCVRRRRQDPHPPLVHFLYGACTAIPPCPITLFPAIAFCHRCNQLPIIAINARILLATGARDIEFPHKLSPSQPLLPYPAIIIQRIDDSPRPVPWHSNAIPAQRTITLSYARAPASPFLGFRRHHRHPRLDSSHPLIRPNPQCS